MKKTRETAPHVLIPVLLAAFLNLANVQPVRANDLGDTLMDDEIVIADAEVLHTTDMEDLRGGWIDPTGLIYRFAVDVHTHVDGIVSYARSLVLQAGIDGHLQATSSTQLQEAPNLPTGTIANIIDEGKGLVVSDDSGTTTILNQTQSGALANVIMNSANNRVVSQTMDISIVLNNLPNLHAHSSGLRSFSPLSESISMRSMRFGR